MKSAKKKKKKKPVAKRAVVYQACFLVEDAPRRWVSHTVTVSDVRYDGTAWAASLALPQLGFGPRDIWDITAVVGFFNMSNRVASATDMRPNMVYHGQAR